MFETQDKNMPQGWSHIKSGLLREMQLASTFHDCCEIERAMMHARLIGEAIAKEARMISGEGEACVSGLTLDINLHEKG